MSKAGGAHFQNMVRQGKHSPQEMVSEIQEIARVAEKILVMDSQVKEIASLANLYSIKAIEMIYAGDTDRELALAAHEAYQLVEYSSEQSKAIRSMFTEIKEPIYKITSSINKVLNNFFMISQGAKNTGEQSGEGSQSPRVAATEQANKAAEAVDELARMIEEISSIVQSISHYKD